MAGNKSDQNRKPQSPEQQNQTGQKQNDRNDQNAERTPRESARQPQDEQGPRPLDNRTAALGIVLWQGPAQDRPALEAPSGDDVCCGAG